MSKEDYAEFVKAKSPNSRLFSNMLKAFLVGGAICCIGQGITEGFQKFGICPEDSSACTAVVMVFLGALFTGLGLYDDLAKFGGAGTLVPITGFANAVVSPALEFKTEGFITGTGAKMFIIAGPVIVYGICTSVVYGFVLCLLGVPG